jgi:CRISPR-associated protein Cse1 (CRISPR_cse1)
MHNLLDETPWITGSTLDGSQFELPLAQVFTRAHELALITTENPMQTAAILRLMCAAAIAADAVSGQTLDTGKIVDRLHLYRDRFELSGSPDAFMQTPIDCDEPCGIAALDPTRASGGDHTLWDHRTEDDPLPITPAAAARQLVALQAAGAGGLQKGPFPPGSPTRERSGPKGTITLLATWFAIGTTLAETIAINCAGVTKGEPGDAPCWERPTPDSVKRPRNPTGPCDWLTWLPRRIRLYPDGAGGYDRCVIRPGFVHDDDLNILETGYDPHLAEHVTHAHGTVYPARSVWLNPERAQGLYSAPMTPAIEFVTTDNGDQTVFDRVPADAPKKLAKARATLTDKYGDAYDEHVTEDVAVLYKKDTIFPGLAAVAHADRHPDTRVKFVVYGRETDKAKYNGDWQLFCEVDTAIPPDAQTLAEDDDPSPHVEGSGDVPTLF